MTMAEPATRKGTAAAAVMLYAFVLSAFVYTFWTTPLWSMISEARDNRFSFEQLRTAMYNGFPIDEVNAELKTVVPTSTPIAFGRRITKLSDWGAIATALYPRLLDQRSRYRLDIVPVSEPSPDAVDLSRAPGGVVRLYGAQVRKTATGHLPRDPHTLSWLQVLIGALAVAGWGLAVRGLFSGLRVRGSPSVDAVLVPMFGVFFFAVSATLATWLQIPVPSRALVLIGAVFCAASIVRRFRALRVRDAMMRLLLTPDLLVLLAILAFVFIWQTRFPISAWDPRTISMTAAERLAHDGMITRQNMLAPSLARFTHPGYPLLFPATMAVFGAFSPLNERMLAMGIPILFASATLLLWALGRRVLGRWVGVAFTLILVLTVPQLVTWGNADPLIVLLLAASVLAFARTETRFAGWITLALAALTKQEGLFFAGLLAAGLLAYETRLQWKERGRLLEMLWLAPAAVQMFLARVVWRLPEDFTIVQRGALTPHSAAAHAAVIGQLLPWTLSRFGLLRIGLIALPLAIGLCISRWRTAAGAIATGASMVGVLFFSALMFTVPIQWTWSAAAPSLYRLFLHSAALAMLGVLLPLRSAFPTARAAVAVKRNLKRIRYALADVIDPAGKVVQPVVVSPKRPDDAVRLG